MYMIKFIKDLFTPDAFTLKSLLFMLMIVLCSTAFTAFGFVWGLCASFGILCPIYIGLYNLIELYY